MLRRNARRSRGAALLEFAFVLPIFLFLITFSIDMGRMTFYSGILHDAAFTSARAGAQLGYAGTDTNGPSRTALSDAVASLPGGGSSVSGFHISSGTSCVKAAGDPNNYVTVQLKYKVDLITPGLTQLLNATNSSSGPWTLKATGVARCEVVRQ